MSRFQRGQQAGVSRRAAMRRAFAGLGLAASGGHAFTTPSRRISTTNSTNSRSRSGRHASTVYSCGHWAIVFANCQRTLAIQARASSAVTAPRRGYTHV